MKKALLIVYTIIDGLTAAAQPTLTAATSTPVIGDIYYRYFCNTTGVPTGDTGSNITWDYSSLSVTSRDTVTVLDGAATPYTDSFPGVTLAEYLSANGEYVYYNTSTHAMRDTGAYFPPATGGAGCIFETKPATYLSYPFTFGNALNDSCAYIVYSSAQSSQQVDTMLADGYGTLILPSGTYTNVLRISHSVYTSTTVSSGTSTDRDSIFYWYMPGYHYPLLTIFIIADVLTGATINTLDVVYSPPPAATFAQNIASENDIAIYPNPATDIIHIRAGVLRPLSVIATDILGKHVAVSYESVKDNELSITTSNWAAGLYLLHVQTDRGMFVRKVAVTR